MQEILKNETEEKVYSTLDKLNIKKSKIINKESKNANIK